MFQTLKTRFEVVASLGLLAITAISVLILSNPKVMDLFRFAQDTSHLYITEGTVLIDADDADLSLYDQAFAAQEQGDWKQADNIIDDINNPILMGHLLAQRYLHPHYKSTAEELSAWLQSYSDHPQAGKIYQLARTRGVDFDMPSTVRRNLTGYGESYKNMRQESPRIAGIWKTGLNYWKQKKYAKAYHAFTSLEENGQTMGDWDRAAFSFWAYRAADAMDENNLAEKHLKLAARFPRSFYGAQAVHLLGETLNDTVALRGEATLDDYLQKVDSADTRNALRRIEALLKIHHTNLAREDMLLQYSRADVKDRVAFVPIAQQLNLPALQLRMGIDMERKGVTSGEALYPLPVQWMPKDGYIVDPALVFAVARQESGFNAAAVSYSGARGTMQIMPSTAKYVAEQMKVDMNLSLNDPTTSIDLGQNYLSYLANKPYIKGNIVLLAAAYNAGPGNAKRWSKNPAMFDDPLYFIETIPFSETRDYVMNVMTNYWMYREIMNEDDDADAALLSQGQWPVTITRSAEMATADLRWPNSDA